jgi:predicted dehydrogenase
MSLHYRSFVLTVNREIDKETRSLKVGLIGCGGIAPLHMKVYKRLKGVQVVAVCDLDQERAKNLAARFQIKKTFSNYWDMFEKEGLDLVDICTPVTTHTQIACDAAQAVPAILMEKPMALNVSECDKIISEVKKSGSKLCIGHNQIFSPHIQKAKSMVNSGMFNLNCFSTIQKESFEILKKYHLAPEWNVSPKQKGIIWEVCCHLAYLQLHFLPDIREISAVGGKFRYPVYDDFAVLLRTGEQRFGIIDLSWLSNETETIYEFRDTTGRRVQIHWEYDYFLENTEEPPFTVGNVARGFLVDEKRILQKWLRFSISYFQKRKLLPTFNLISSYVEAVKKDLPPPVSPEEGRKTINLLECIEKSLETQQSIKLAT